MPDLELPNELDDDDFASEEETEGPGEFATILMTGGNRVFLPIQRNEAGEIVPQTIMEAAVAAFLTVPASTQFWVEGVQIDPNVFTVAPNMQITGVGAIKGG